MKDRYFLTESLKLAQKGMGWVNPNPMVGAVLVKDNKVIGTGYHKKTGLPHAEIEALKSCQKSSKGATMYVNLEPCNHFGKTPPCTDKIIQAGIKKVVCASLDPNPKVLGQGIAVLQKMGIEVQLGILEKEARLLNEAFFTFHEYKRPFIAIKFGASLDGKIATYSGNSKWITNTLSRDYGRILRGQYQAVLVGINTVLLDNPHLGARMKGLKDPVRIILDSRLRIPLDALVLRDKQVLIVTTRFANQKKLTELQKQGFDVIIFDENIKITKLLKILQQKEIISVLVEGGGQILGSFIDAKMVDKVYAFHTPILIGGVEKIQDALKLSNITFKKFGDDLLTIGYTSCLNQFF